MDFISVEMPKEAKKHLKRYGDFFPRRESRKQFRHYVGGLISETRRKSIWQVMGGWWMDGGA